MSSIATLLFYFLYDCTVVIAHECVLAYNCICVLFVGCSVTGSWGSPHVE